MSPDPTTAWACLWPNDVAPWKVEMPISPGGGIPSRLSITIKIGWQTYEIQFELKDYSDGCSNFYETSRKRLAPAY